MPPKKQDPAAAAAKLEPDEGLQLENLNLAVEREEIFTRMNVLNKECKKFKTMYQKLEDRYENLQGELEQEKGRALADRQAFDLEKVALDSEIRQLKEKATAQQQQNDADRAAERKSYEDQIKVLEELNNKYLEEENQMKEFRNEKQKKDELIEQLKLDVENEKKARLNDGTEKDRDKLQATEKLRREMLK